MEMWELYSGGSPTTSTTQDSESSWDVSGFIQSLGKTYIGVQNARTQLENAKNGVNDQTVKEYENIQQQTTQKPGVSLPSSLNSKTLVYAGVGAAAIYLIFGGK